MSGADAGELPLAARTVRKVAIRLVPFLMLLFFVNYLDRTTLGIAKTGLTEQPGRLLHNHKMWMPAMNEESREG